MSEPTFELLIGDARAQLRTLQEDSVHVVVTSPPYWQLRDYGTEPQVWGGDPEHEHEWVALPPRTTQGNRSDPALKSTLGNGTMSKATIGRQLERQVVRIESSSCSCGAWRGELGQEPNPDLFVEHLVEVFDEVRRVLRPDGVCFVNIDDSYVGGGGGNYGNGLSNKVDGAHPTNVKNRRAFIGQSGVKAKELALVPARLSLALQKAGWWIRCDNVWSKPDGMPESVTDRPTRSHEYLFMLTKSPSYFWDQEAVRETPKSDRPQTQRAWEIFEAAGLTEEHLVAIRAVGMNDAGKAREVQTGNGKNDPAMQALADEAKAALGGYYREFLTVGGRNIRSVWTIPTDDYPEAHFATMSKDVAERAIRAATSEKGCCDACGAPVVREVERRSISRHELPPDHPGYRPARYENGKAGDEQSPGAGQRFALRRTLGWKPSCSCGAEIVPCRVLDPFGGAATTSLVAKRLGRSSVAVELSPEFAVLAERRMATWWKDVTPQRSRRDESQLALEVV